MRISLIYAILALIATAANIGMQEIVSRFYHGWWSLLLSMAAGTAVGLVVKYLLDKRYIFRFRARSAAHDGQAFLLYTLTGVGTTLIFLGFEVGFDYLFASKAMRYTGAAMGLSIGYLVKYQLDKRYVFCSPA